MFEASVDGQPYDTERWGSYYRPAGVQAPAGAAPAASTADVDEDAPTRPMAKPVVAAKSAPAASGFDDEDAEVAVAAAPVAAAKSPQKAEDILAMIRARQQK